MTGSRSTTAAVLIIIAAALHGPAHATGLWPFPPTQWPSDTAFPDADRKEVTAPETEE